MTGLRPPPSARSRIVSRTIPGHPSPSFGGWSRTPLSARPRRARISPSILARALRRALLRGLARRRRRADRAVSQAWEAVVGSPALTGSTTATTDARAFIASGVPAVCIGPHAERIHGSTSAFVPSVVQTAQVLAPRSRLVRPRVNARATGRQLQGGAGRFGRWSPAPRDDRRGPRQLRRGGV